MWQQNRRYENLQNSIIIWIREELLYHSLDNSTYLLLIVKWIKMAASQPSWIALQFYNARSKSVVTFFVTYKWDGHKWTRPNFNIPLRWNQWCIRQLFLHIHNIFKSIFLPSMLNSCSTTHMHRGTDGWTDMPHFKRSLKHKLLSTLQQQTSLHMVSTRNTSTIPTKSCIMLALITRHPTNIRYDLHHSFPGTL